DLPSFPTRRSSDLQAFDGSGRVTRDKDNYSQCTFSSGKRYHADLNAAYNIAARGHVYYQGCRRKAAPRVGSQKSTGTPRTPVSLSTLWQQSA
ncbi:MAG TPA: transposase, partial [Halomonas sp.]|nr:transposase [Halomonas sp.]